MRTHGHEDLSATCMIDLPAETGKAGPHLDDYLLNSAQTLDALSERVGRGEKIDMDSHDWMLSQVDFLVETIGKESPELGDDQRANLLQLLLTIANLNELIRHQGLLSL